MHRQGLLMERAAVARRVKRHLVTRPVSDGPATAAITTAIPQPMPAAAAVSASVAGLVPPRLSHSLEEPGRLRALFSPEAADVPDESGYAGDINEDYDPSALLTTRSEGPVSAYGDEYDDNDEDDGDYARKDGVVVDPMLLASGDMT
ncbi:hypothetical protein IWW38_003581, partial [Coemansia aciculifera]